MRYARRTAAASGASRRAARSQLRPAHRSAWRTEAAGGVRWRAVARWPSAWRSVRATAASGSATSPAASRSPWARRRCVERMAGANQRTLPPESYLCLPPSRNFKGRASSERRAALKPCVSLWAIPRHLIADTVSCSIRPSRLVPHASVESSYFCTTFLCLSQSSNVSLLVLSAPPVASWVSATHKAPSSAKIIHLSPGTCRR